MAKYPGLYKRGGVWYVRKKVPLELRHLFTKEQLRKSLRTGDWKLALRLYAPTLTEIERGFELKRSELGRKDRTTQALLAAKLERLSEAEIDVLLLAWWGKRTAVRRPEVDDFDRDEVLQEIEADLQDIVAPRERDPACALADQLLVEAGMFAQHRKVGRITTTSKSPVVDRSSEQYRYLCDRVRTALKIESELAKDYLLGQRSAPADPQFNPITGAPSRSSGSSMRRTLGEMLTA